MYSLNKESKAIFSHLLDRMKGEDSLTLTTPEFMPLELKCIGSNFNAPAGDAKLYSLAHYYEANGKNIYDPLMHFVVVDIRHLLNMPDMIVVTPYLYRQDNIGKLERSINMENNRMTTYYSAMQKDHTVFAQLWLNNIKMQGFVQ